MAGQTILIAGLIAAAVSCAGQEQGRGSVKVTVLREHDLPVAGATVLADPILIGNCAMGYALPECLTDKSGSCTLTLEYGGPGRECLLGKYSVSVSKEADGYPKLFLQFYAAVDPTHKPTEVEVTASHPTDAITVHLGKRGGILTGTVVDALTGKRLNANITLRWASNPGIVNAGGWLANSKFRMLVPSETPVTMVVSEKGYEDWTYAQGKGAMKNAIRLGPGEEKRLDIRLQPRR
jgi:hypothetical protein